MNRLARTFLIGVVVAAVACVLAAFAAASNAPAISFASPPSPTEAQTLTSNSVHFAFTYNRKPTATSALICDLSGPTSSSGPCDSPVADGKADSSSQAFYSGLKDGSYTFTVTLTLTDGGTATAVRHFTIAVCTGSEDFSEFPEFSTPTTFSGGTIDDPYGPAGGVIVQGSFLAGGFAPGAHVLFSGLNSDTFQLTFTNPTGFLQLDASDGDKDKSTTITLTAYDASNGVVGTDQFFDPDNTVQTLSVTSATDNIKYFTVHTNDATNFQFPNGVDFTNIAWRCA